MEEKYKAIAVAKKVARDCEHIRSSSTGRHEFDYDGVVDSFKLPDGWEMVGFSSSGWFELKKD
jgi:hypothetical protein